MDDTAEVKKIKKPWCIYKGILFFSQGIGKIEREGEVAASVRYSEGQYYPLEAWGNKYLERFETIEEAVKKFVKDTGQHTMEEMIKIKFPSEFKKDSV